MELRAGAVRRRAGLVLPHCCPRYAEPASTGRCDISMPGNTDLAPARHDTRPENRLPPTNDR